MLAYRVQKMLEYSEQNVQVFDAEQMYTILECIMIFENGKIVVRYLDGRIVEM